jgi:putative ABC transport system permease protein
MFRNYLTIALRSIVRHKLYSVINIAGLAVGLACAIFIALFIQDELSYDKWIPDTANIYQVDVTLRPPGLPPMVSAVAPFPLAAFMKDHFPEVTAATRLSPVGMTVNIGDRQFFEIIDEVDSNFFQTIKLPLISGDPAQVLQQPESAVISRSTARKYFGDADPIGKTIGIAKAACGLEQVACAEKEPLRVTGVMADLPHNSQFTGDVFIPHTSVVDRLTEAGKESWSNLGVASYVRLAPGGDPQALLGKLGLALDRDVNVKSLSNLPTSKFVEVSITPFTRVHLDTEGKAGGGMTPPGSWSTIYGLGVIGALILLIACFNFMNLATARATMRAREIALRKCVGANRRQLIIQFLGESVLMAILALLVALAMVEILLPAYGRFLGRPLALHYMADWSLLAAIVVLAIAAGLLSGIYPALVLSSFRPATVLKANKGGQHGSGLLRTTLAVLQFSVSIGLTVVAFVVFSQTNYERKLEMGFRRDNIVAINVLRRLNRDQRESFANILRNNPGVLQVAQSSDVPLANIFTISMGGVPGGPDTIPLDVHTATPNFPELYGMRLLAGRLLSEVRGEDVVAEQDTAEGLKADPRNEGHNILINETAAKRFGYTPQQAIGKPLILNKNQLTIVGVLADAKINGARQAVKPGVFLYNKSDIRFISVLLRPDSVPATLGFIDKTWRRFAPTTVVTRRFIRDDFARLYLADEKQGTLLAVFVGLAIFIACMGLFGLAAFTAGRRTREIGIRKVFGARVRDVLALLLWQFSVPVLLANLIAWPAAWYYLHGWLQGFVYRVSLSPLYFFVAGFGALLIAWITILAHALRVARTNPIHALRYE